ncbi:MAG: peptidoglycan-binding protein [Rhodobacter sp.]|uniref:peptidoglycan-binding domain-containing protein n=1 Tax=Pararhodobacter sp. TaxID=2127056 RepID=UPI001DBE2F2D|nr:peptidoglycan-binding protein [Pararhodobacter sp.]MCB1344394.1 peptidoglycan-binding protein [Paracoccaceae bacterium]MCC0074614.1 peptidoglycan-binding protein [Rhodobacter sp.]HPD91708.1 peptidoglycan-binding protein [Pararhodobacter sp.]
MPAARFLACLVLLGAPAGAETVLGPQGVAPPGVLVPCQGAGLTPAFWRCLTAAGVPDQGLAFARRLAADPAFDQPAIPMGFTELGAVDLADVLFPFMANTNDQQLLVNGDPAVLHPLALEPPRPDDPVSAALVQAHPHAFPTARVGLTAARRDGTRQRFVFLDPLADGCRACEVVGASLFAIDFDAGRQTGIEALGWVPVTLAEPDLRAGRIQSGDIQALQVALVLRGYRPGALDGVMGAATRAALAAFQRDYCLTSESLTNFETLEALSASAPDLSPPTCSEGVGP